MQKDYFYDKIARKFGGYKTTAIFTTYYPTENPEEVFKENLIKFSGKDKTALDLGCGDGRFTLEMAPYFKKIIGIDLAKEMLKIAENLKRKSGIKNVKFKFADAFSLLFKDKSFNLIYSRRGPTPFGELKRVLVPTGYILTIRIGEQDARSLKEIFGRGQNFGQWDKKILEKDRNILKGLGFRVLFAEEYFYEEHYKDLKNLSLFLEGVPIFEDFDPQKDKKFLEKYKAKFTTKRGIKLPRHRIVLVVQLNI